VSIGQDAKRREVVLFLVVALSCASTVLVSTQMATVDLQGTIAAGGRPSADAVIWLDGADSAKPAPPKTVVLDQHGLSFVPHVLAIQVGTTVELPNNDRVFHNVFSFHDGKKFDLGLYPVGTRKRVRFDQAGVSRVFCNIHQNMAAYVVTVDTPYFAVSDRDGRFTIPAVPQGTYTYHAWHSGKDPLSGSATVAPRAGLNIEWR
jgi:plastocyanin